MKTVLEYELGITRITNILLPKGAKILRVDFHPASPPLMWAEVDTEADQEKRIIEVFRTGHEIPPGKRVYINTFMTPEKTVIYHAYEKLPK